MNKKIAIFFYLTISSGLVLAQTPIKEAVNTFALYSKSGDFAVLEKSRKTIDAVFKARRDSLSYRNNLLRCMVYSCLANMDQNRKLAYLRDPADEALSILSKLKDLKHKEERQEELAFCKKQLANYFIRKANSELNNLNYSGALISYKMIDSLSSGDFKVKHNLAILSERAGDFDGATTYYLQLIDDKNISTPAYFLELSTIYDLKGDEKSSVAILQEGRLQFPGNRDLLFKIINKYSDKAQYDAITAIIDEAVRIDPGNLNLNYIAGFSYDAKGNHSLAAYYYQKVIDLEPNNFDANYSLGILYLNLYLKNKKEDMLTNARKYLHNAVEISPNGTNILKSLAVLYKNTGETTQLERVNNKLNQIIFN